MSALPPKADILVGKDWLLAGDNSNIRVRRLLDFPRPEASRVIGVIRFVYEIEIWCLPCPAQIIGTS
jgi:hypothetical protein